MKVIPYLHDFVSQLPRHVRDDIESHSRVRLLARGETAYRKDDVPNELFRLLEGGIKLCNYSLDGSEHVTGEFRAGDCFGEMGVLDGMPRVSHAVASRDSRVSVISKEDFDKLCKLHPDIHRELNLMLCRRMRFLYALNEESVGLKLHARLARAIHRLAYSHGRRDDQSGTYIEMSHEELSNMLGASRQSVSKELKLLEQAGDITLRYGKIYLHDLSQFGEKYEKSVGMEQVVPAYHNDD